MDETKKTWLVEVLNSASVLGKRRTYSFKRPKENQFVVCALLQDYNWGGEERSLASYCRECFHSHEPRGEGERAEHVQRCELSSLQDHSAIKANILMSMFRLGSERRGVTAWTTFPCSSYTQGTRSTWIASLGRTLKWWVFKRIVIRSEYYLIIGTMNTLDGGL